MDTFKAIIAQKKVVKAHMKSHLKRTSQAFTGSTVAPENASKISFRSRGDSLIIEDSVSDFDRKVIAHMCLT